jgi:hypothetical protein
MAPDPSSAVTSRAAAAQRGVCPAEIVAVDVLGADARAGDALAVVLGAGPAERRLLDGRVLDGTAGGMGADEAAVAAAARVVVTVGATAAAESTGPATCLDAGWPELQALTRTAITTRSNAVRRGDEPTWLTQRPGRSDPPGIS